MKKFLSVVFAAATALPVSAASIEYTFTADRSSVTNSASVTGQADSLSLLNSISGTFTFDNTPAAGTPVLAGTGYGPMMISIDGIALASGTFQPQETYVVNDLPNGGAPFDAFTSFVTSVPPTDGIRESVSFFLLDTTATAFVDESFPTPFVLGDFDQSFLQFDTIERRNGTNIFGDQTSFSLTSLTQVTPPAVPLPASGLLLGLGLLGAGAYGHRRKPRTTRNAG